MTFREFLLNPKHETQVIGSIRKPYLDSKLEFSMSGFYSIQAADSFLEPMFDYHFTDNFSLSAGYLKIASPRKTLFGQFHDNDEVFARAGIRFELWRGLRQNAGSSLELLGCAA